MASDNDTHSSDTHESHGHGSAPSFEIIEEGGATDNLLNLTALVALLVLGWFCTVMVTAAHPEAEAAPPVEQHAS